MKEIEEISIKNMEKENRLKRIKEAKDMDKRWSKKVVEANCDFIMRLNIWIPNRKRNLFIFLRVFTQCRKRNLWAIAKVFLCRSCC